MRKISLLIGIIGAFALPAVASAKSRNSCKPATPVDLSLSTNSAVSCQTARAVERYENSHETAGQAFSANKREWLGTIYSRAHNHTYYVFVSPGKQIGIVWVVARLPVS